LSSSPSLSLSPPPVDVARRRHILPLRGSGEEYGRREAARRRRRRTMTTMMTMGLASVAARDEFFHRAHGEG
jgi:hypothetical protein